MSLCLGWLQVDGLLRERDAFSYRENELLTQVGGAAVGA